MYCVGAVLLQYTFALIRTLLAKVARIVDGREPPGRPAPVEGLGGRATAVWHPRVPSEEHASK